MIRLIVNLTPQPPAEGLAVEEAIFEGVRGGGQDTLRVWVNERAVVVGRSQAVAAEVDLKCARKLGIPILRRLSGGGTVYHYPGNLNISLYLSDGRTLGGVEEAFGYVGGSIARGLASLGIAVRVRKNNLFIDDKKIAGAAQARRGNALLYHTTLLTEPDTIPMNALLLAMCKGYKPAGAPSHPYPTTTLGQVCESKLAPEMIAQALAEEIALPLKRALRRGTLIKDERTRARELTEEKYGNDQWNLYR